VLVLSRKLGEAIVVGDPDGRGAVRVSVERIQGRKVRLGVATSRDVPITREELLAREAGGPPAKANGYCKPETAAAALAIVELAAANERQRRATLGLVKHNTGDGHGARAASYHAGYATALRHLTAKLEETEGRG
jgi:carbon storage regulator CsrA